MEYVYYTVDGAMAIVGGYSAIVWGLLSMMLSGYEDFKHQNFLAKELYTIEKSKPNSGRRSVVKDEKEDDPIA